MSLFIKTLLHLLRTHLLALALLTAFRLVMLTAIAPDLTPDASGRYDLYAMALLRGLWFDNVVCCAVMLPAVLVVGVSAVGGWWHRRTLRGLHLWLGITYALIFAASAANIPYFLYFTKILNASIWNWAEYGTTTLGMLFGEASYYIYMGLFALATALMAWWLHRSYVRHHAAWVRQRGLSVQQRLAMAGVSLALGSLCLFGVRGRMGYNPIKVSAAYFCQSTLLNNLGVNPMFCLLSSTFDDLRPENRTLHLLPSQQAVRGAQQLLGRQGMPGLSPLAREVKPEGQPTGQNVVMILMESMSAKLMARFGHTGHLTPFLDSLYTQSLAFSNCYSSGNHTNHGLYASLYAFPSIMFRNAMKGSNIPRYDGLPTALQQAGYRTLFFMTHESQYDNMNAFFRTNGYDEVYAQEDYPRSARVNNFGVSDGFLFSYALPVLRRKAASGKPFFATLLTISNHPPYVVPEAFARRAATPEEQIVAYADHCLRQFITAALREPWGRNTLFVLVGDHGKLVGKPEGELPESYNHVPLLFFGRGITPQERTDFVGQIDIAPTVLGLLRLPYVQHDFGIDALREQRPAIFYSADKTIAARNDSALFVYSVEHNRTWCYDLHHNQCTPARNPRDAAFTRLRHYVFTMLQAAESLVQQGYTTRSTHAPSSRSTEPHS